MSSSDIDRFYTKVTKDFIANLGNNQKIVAKMEENNIDLNQIEERILSKLKEPSLLFRRFMDKDNEIEKEMMVRYPFEAPKESQQQVLPQQDVQEVKDEVQESESFSNDLDIVSDSNSRHLVISNTIVSGKYGELKKPEFKKEEKVEESPGNKRAASEYSGEDFSDIEQDPRDAYKKMREEVKIHILGTYDLFSKKHNFKKETTEATLDNVFIKVEGMSREIFLKRMHCTTRKKVHE